MKIDDTGFNVEWAKKKTEAQFVDEFKDVADVLPIEPGEKPEDRIGRLKSAYKMLKDYDPKAEEKAAKKVPRFVMPGAELEVTVVPG